MRRLRQTLGWMGIIVLMSMTTALLHYSCGAQRLEVKGGPTPAFDAIIVPGCPAKPDGALSTCQSRRATWAALLWERGYAHHFITSGAAAQNPFVEAESLAAAMAALGVPAERIYLAEADPLRRADAVIDNADFDLPRLR